jgi:phage shock protein PspC (stress-responsive transcriptional regulator)
MERHPCPFCAEDIRVGAIRCPHCRSRLDPIASIGSDRWHREHSGRRLAGVAAGIAATTGLPVAVVRAAFIVLTFVHLAGPVLYAALWVTMPDGPGDEPFADRVIDAIRDLFGPSHRSSRPFAGDPDVS